MYERASWSETVGFIVPLPLHLRSELALNVKNMKAKVYKSNYIINSGKSSRNLVNGGFLEGSLFLLLWLSEQQAAANDFSR